MNVLCANVMGMCGGVRRALEMALAVEQPAETVILGELVHNEQVCEMLGQRGFRHVVVDNGSPIPEAAQALIPSHGVSRIITRKLEEAGKQLIDATCPFVRGIHETVQSMQREGRFVVVIGKRGHAEVEGVIGGCTHCAVASCPEDVVSYPSEQLGIVCQSTVSPGMVECMMNAICACNPGKSLCFAATICPATRERQAAVEALLGQVEAVVVVGGKTSNNTVELAALVRAHGVSCFHIQSAAELRDDWFQGMKTIGLTAGASTPEPAIREVQDWLEQCPGLPSAAIAENRSEALPSVLKTWLPASYAVSSESHGCAMSKVR